MKKVLEKLLSFKEDDLDYYILEADWNFVENIDQSQKPTACYTTLKLTTRLSRIDLIYNPSKFRGDISNFTRKRRFSVK